MALAAPGSGGAREGRGGTPARHRPPRRSGYLPEHTLQSYALAIKLGADYVEPDLVATKDGHLIARHEPDITNTTDVRQHPEFADRETTKTVDGVETTGWFASDFTLAEIKTLRAVQTFPERPQRFNGRFKIPTLEEVIDLVKRESRKRDRRIGIYPETKHPTYHKDLGLPLEPRLVKILKRAGWDSRRDPVFIQSFEQSNLKRLNRMIGVRLVQLVDANDVLADGTLEYVAPFDRPTTGPSPATRSSWRARSASSPPTRASRRSAPTRTGSARGSATSSARWAPGRSRHARSRRRPT